MKEILYIQAGSLANYTGTHFWNTQESYFTYDEDDVSDPPILHDVSFREGLTQKGDPTFCPRLLVFDRKSNFGSLADTDMAFGVGDLNGKHEDLIWNGEVITYEQDAISKSPYQSRLDNESGDHENDEISPEDYGDSSVRYWSDYNRVYYIPRTIHKLPDIPEWVDTAVDWSSGQDEFVRYDGDYTLMEGPLRMFLEECDSIQGIQVINDTATFGSFTAALLTSFHDEYLKLPSLVFPLLSDAIPGFIDIDNFRGVKKAVNDALSLQVLNDLASTSIPIQHPSTWSPGPWRAGIGFCPTNMYHTSAVLSAHIETSTLPLRLRESRDDLTSFSSQLDWRGSSRFGQLSGAFPISPTVEFNEGIYNFSSTRSSIDVQYFARRDVTRGFSAADLQIYSNWCNLSELQDSFTTSIHTFSYPLPTSFPPFFEAPHLNVRRQGILTPPTVSMISSISTSSQTADLFSSYAVLVDECIRRKWDSIGLDMDELRELGNDLWTIHDNYVDERKQLAEMLDHDGDTFGEDEE